MSTMMTIPQMEELARSNVERHLGDCFDGEGEPSADSIYDEACTLGVDALIDAGVAPVIARGIARSVAQCFAQP